MGALRRKAQSGMWRAVKHSAVAAAWVLMVVSCAAGDAGQESDQGSSLPGWPYTDCGEVEDACFDSGDFNFYCGIQQARELVEADDMTLEDFPEKWRVEGETENGEPRIYEFRDRYFETIPGKDLLNQLNRSVADATGEGLNFEQVTNCRQALTQDDVAESEDGWPQISDRPS